MSHPLGLVGLYLLAVTPALLVGPWTGGHLLLTLLHVGVAALCLSKAREPGEPAPALAWVPLLALSLLYWEIPFLSQGLASGYHDPLVAGWEAALFGSPAMELAGRFPSVALSEVLHLAYIAFYPIIYVPPAILFFRGRHEEFVTTAIAIGAAATLCYTVFTYFPVQGPRYFGPPQGVPSGPIRAFTLAILENGSSQGTAFPSSHLAIAACQAVVTLRFQPRLGIVVTVLAAGLGLGAVYGGFHYGIDMVVGGAVGVGVALAVLRMRVSDTTGTIGETA